MAINERLVHTASAAGAGTASAEQNLILHLDANDVDSYDGDGSVWYDISEHDVTIPLSSDDSDNLKIHYNPSDTNSYSGTGTTLTNLAGSSLDATVVASRFDIDNGGFFDISTDGEQSIVIPSGHPLNGEFTLEFWFKFQSTPVAGNRFIYDLGETKLQFFFYKNNGWRFYQASGQESGYYGGGSGGIEVGKWQHKVITLSSSGSFKAYIDGELVKSASWTRPTTSLGAFDFGTTDITADKPKCDIGAIRMYDKVLSASEVGQNYRHGRDYIYTDLAGTPFLHYDPADTNSYSGTGTTLTDLAGNNDADLLGGIESSYDEELGNWFDITGSGDGITTSSPVSINPNTSGMSIELWFKLDADNFNYLFSFDGTDTTYMALSYRANLDKVVWFYRTGSAALDSLYTPTIELNKWHHLVATTDGSSGELYFNGELSESSTSATYSRSYNEDLHFANMYDLAQNNNTQIGQIRFYKGGLTADEVMQNYLFTKNNYPNEIHFTGNNISSADWNSSGYFDLDGSTEYFETSGTPSALINANNFTFQLWVKMHTTGTTDYIASQTTDDGNNQNWLLRFHSDNKIKFYVYGTDEYLSTTSTYSANTWYHIAGVVEADGTVKIYVNGTLEVSSSSGKSADTVSRNTFIGSLGQSSSGRFDGDIGAVKYYKKALTAAELLADYNATKSTYGL